MERGDVIFFFGGALVLGIFLGSIHGLLFAALAAVFILVFGTKKFSFKICILLVLSLLFGYYYFFLFNRAVSAYTILPQGESFTGKIINEPKVSGNSRMAEIEFIAPNRGTADLIVPLNTNVALGDVVRSENYILGDQERSAKPRIFSPTLEFIKNEKGGIKWFLFGIKKGITNIFYKNLSPSSASLLSGITFGERAEFSAAMKQDMARSGTTHLVALSGYNIAILVLAVGALTKKAMSRRKSFWLTLTAICGFIIMVGGEASVIRAAIMGFLVLLAKQSGRIYDMRNSIVLAAVLMALWNPFVLRFDLGFILSFLSLIGIVYLSPALQEKFWKSEKAEYLKEGFSTTLSAQLAVIPVLALSFGQLSPFSFLPNMLIIFLVPLVMLFGFVLGILGNILFWLVFPLVWILELILRYMLGVMHLFANLGFQTGTSYSYWIIFVYYALILLFIYSTQKPHARI